MGNVLDSCQSSKEWASQEIQPKVIPCSAQSNSKKPKSYMSEASGLD